MTDQLRPPTKEEVRNMRQRAGLTQQQAAALVHRQRVRWTEWESGTRNMQLDTYELFLIKSGQRPVNPPEA